MTDPSWARPTLHSVQVIPCVEPALPVVPTTEENDPYVIFTVQVRRSTYLRIKQAEFWTPGFGEIRKHIDGVLKAHFTLLPGSHEPLPDKELAKLKKLKG